MCGRFTLTEDNRELVAQRLGIAPSEVFDDRYVPRWNIAPMQEHWIVRAELEERRIVPAIWGLAGGRDSRLRGASRPINVRAESVVRGAFRTAFGERRCVVPADGFFEWAGETKTRRPFWFHRPDRDLFVFAGLYAEATAGGEPEPATTFTILTTEANAIVAAVHDRMPVILAGDDTIEEWLYPKQPAGRLHTLLRPAPDDFLVATAVSTRVNSVQNDDPACLAEAEAEMQGPLI